MDVDTMQRRQAIDDVRLRLHAQRVAVGSAPDRDLRRVHDRSVDPAHDIERCADHGVSSQTLRREARARPWHPGPRICEYSRATSCAREGSLPKGGRRSTKRCAGRIVDAIREIGVAAGDQLQLQRRAHSGKCSAEPRLERRHVERRQRLAQTTSVLEANGAPVHHQVVVFAHSLALSPVARQPIARGLHDPQQCRLALRIGLPVTQRQPGLRRADARSIHARRSRCAVLSSATRSAAAVHTDCASRSRRRRETGPGPRRSRCASSSSARPPAPA